MNSELLPLDFAAPSCVAVRPTPTKPWEGAASVRCENADCTSAPDAPLHRHHIQPRRFGGGEQPENFILLCARCHAMVHAVYAHVAMELISMNNPDFFKNALASVVARRG